MSDKLARLLFPDVKSTPEELEKRYPPRNLPSEACVTRFAPSPTGFLHLGNLWSSLIDERLAHQSGGVFYLRLEDTDQKREIKGAIQGIFNFLNGFDLNLDEGFTPNGEIGAYGPYVQSERKPIYEVFAKQLVFEGKAYPCFCAPEQLEEIKKTQNASKENTGYYGKWAKCRDLTFEEIESKINNGEPYIIRFRSPGDEKKRITVNDLVKGSLELPENIRDELVLKSDGLPTYHFAHVVDDHLMHTTHVVRGDEYLSTLPVHAQFFEAFGWEMPQYIHHAMLQKQEGESKRKLSKRKDPELSLDYYGEVGYMPECLKEYIMTLLNSNYEEWRMADPRAKLEQFGFKIEKLSPSGALFDLNKLNDISKNYISALSADEIYAQVTNWAKKHDIDLYHILNIQEKYAKDILSIGRGGDKPRKDVTFMSEVKNYLSYFYDDLFVPDYKMPESFAQKPEIDSHVIKNIAEDYIEIYEPSDDAAVWFDKIKQLAAKHGFAPETKLYKKNPQEYKGSVGDVSMILRVAVCGRQNSPDMHEVFSIMGKDMIRHRLAHFQNESIRPKFPKRAVITGGMPYGEKEIYFHHVGGYFIHADIFARFMRDRIGPENVLFVSGIDCYGAGVEIGYEKAAAGGFSGTLPEFVAQNHKIQKETLDKYQISLDIYAGSALGEAGKIHAALSEEIFEKLYTGGFLKLERATQFFDAEKGLYLNGRQVKGRCPIQGCKSENAYADECSLGHQYKPEELIEPVSVLSGKVPDRVFSDNWFFDLPAYEKRLKSAVDEWKNDPACRKTLITVINE
ncbi:MAG: glutamate--tRNA ligase, partial [Oscillospiraceae bacterium]|nr:glutamate--tRNA ligase [Oscillospiraceae bacterium]